MITGAGTTTGAGMITGAGMVTGAVMTTGAGRITGAGNSSTVLRRKEKERSLLTGAEENN
jgi:hypothetical protein